MRSLFYNAYQVLRRLLFEPLFLLTGYTPAKYRLSSAEEDFIAANAGQWKDVALPEQDGSATVLVFGHMAGEGVNYALRLGTIGRGLSVATGGAVTILLPRCRYNSLRIYRLLKSFGFKQFYYLRCMDRYPLAHLWAMLQTVRWFCVERSVERLLQIDYAGIDFGDVVYNDIIHDAPGLYTISQVRLRYAPFIYRFYLYARAYNRMLDDFPAAKVLLTTHVQYVTFGTLVRLALARGLTVVETTDLATAVFEPSHLQTGVDYFSHMRREISQRLAALDNDSELVAAAERELAARFSGHLAQMDAQLAYGNKVTLNEEELRRTIGADVSRPLVSIFGHVFSDTPVGASRRPLFPDYYVWLRRTLEIAITIPEVHWIFKPHPAQERYGERADVEALFAAVIKNARNTNLSWCPDNLSTSTLIEHSRTIITCQGTIALECSCMGTPAIVAGSPFYGGFGFTFEPSTISEYESLLRRSGALPRLGPAQIRKAKAVYGIFSQLATAEETGVIDPSVLDSVWGYRSEANSDAAYREVTRRLATVRLSEQASYRRALSFRGH